MKRFHCLKAWDPFFVLALGALLLILTSQIKGHSIKSENSIEGDGGGMQFIETLDNEIPSAKIPTADECELKIKEILKIRFERLELHYQDRIRAILKDHEEVVRLRIQDKSHFDGLEANLRSQIIALTHQLSTRNQEKGLHSSKMEPTKIGETSVILHDEGRAVPYYSKRFFDDPRILNSTLLNRKKRQQQQNSVCSKNNHCTSQTAQQCTFFFPDHPDVAAPFPLGYDRTKKKGDPNTQPPGNCGDLYKLGHTLPGLYIVQSTKDNNVRHAIIHCVFPTPTSPTSIPIVNEPSTGINYLDFSKCCPSTPSNEQNHQFDQDHQESSYQQNDQQQPQQQQQQGGGLDSIGGLVQQGLNIFGSLGR